MRFWPSWGGWPGPRTRFSGLLLSSAVVVGAVGMGTACAPKSGPLGEDGDADLKAVQSISQLVVDVGQTYLKASEVQSTDLAPEQKCALPRDTVLQIDNVVSGVRTGHVKLGGVRGIRDAQGNAIKCPPGLLYIWRPHFREGIASAPIAEGANAGVPANANALLERIRQAGAALAPGASVGLAAAWMPRVARQTFFANADLVVNSASAAKWLWTAIALLKNPVASVETHAQQVFRLSTNEDAGALIKLAGNISGVNSFIQTNLGLKESQWRLCRWPYVDGITQICPRNYFTARAAMAFISAVYDESLGLPPDKVQKLDEWARLSPDTPRSDGLDGWIGAKLPSGPLKTMRHKAGWIPASAGGDNTVNELALIRPENSGTYAVAITVEGGPSFGRNTDAVEQISCLVYHMFNTPTRDPFKRCQ